ncbi:protein ycf2 [Striga asiatica]|uniref:Protein ycf2 n=1 Tax=Striga asiatica TaxID=4170 RepID=A0A5A7QHQ4_STRAF|nr:protein ycf2 [Striga asiatica]
MLARRDVSPAIRAMREEMAMEDVPIVSGCVSHVGVFCPTRQTWDLQAWVSPAPDHGILSYQIGRAVAQHVKLVIKNGQSTRLNEMNWVPGLNGKKPELRTEVDGSLFWVKDLILAGGVNWDTTLVRALFTETDADRILQIKTLNPRVWTMGLIGYGKKLVLTGSRRRAAEEKDVRRVLLVLDCVRVWEQGLQRRFAWHLRAILRVGRGRLACTAKALACMA